MREPAWGGGWGPGGLLSLGTCAHDSREDPALAVFDWLEPALEPLVQNGHAPTPVQGAGAASVLALPLALNHAPVIVAVHLAEEGTGPPARRAPFSGPRLATPSRVWTTYSLGATPSF